ncbi:hypothetical protein ACFL6E_04910 [Candidatus Neomarinimicrobiota bacterium]
MPSKIDSIKEEVHALVVQGNNLYWAMVDKVQGLPDHFKEELKEKNRVLPNFNNEYDSWYSQVLSLLKQLLPERVDDFIKQYKVEKRKDIDYSTYGISDYLIGLEVPNTVDIGAAIGRMRLQNTILKAVEKRLESSLYDIQEVLQADMFDSELEAAQELTKKGFIRGGGAIAGVVLEKHLCHVCTLHNLKSRKKHPTIADFYQMLKDNEIIDTAKWRFIQHLADLRNLCDHDKGREPTKDDVNELVEGVGKVIKTVF